MTVFTGLMLTAQTASAQTGFPYNDTHWHMYWNDEFSVSAIDTTKWNVIDDYYQPGNNASWYMASQDVVQNGNLFINAVPGVPAGHAAWVQGGSQFLQYTSGEVTTKGKFSMEQGYVEARIYAQPHYGTWPAFWFLPESGQWPPELDVMEAPMQTNIYQNNNGTQVYSCGVHGYQNAHNGGGWNAGNVTSGWHTYGIFWNQNTGEFKFYFDGTMNRSFTDTYCTKAYGLTKMYILIDYAIGGWASGNYYSDGSINLSAPVKLNGDNWTSSHMQVDYVRAFTWSP